MKPGRRLVTPASWRPAQNHHGEYGSASTAARCSWQNADVLSSGRLAALSVVVAIGALAAYVLLLRVVVVRNHPEGYVVAFALATALALAMVRAGLALARRAVR